MNFGFTINKAITAFLIPMIVSAIQTFVVGLPGVSGGMTLKEVIPALVTAFFVWLVPNAKKD